MACGALLTVAPALAQATAQKAPDAAQLYKTRCFMCHQDGNSQLKDLNFADGEWKHGTSVKEISSVIRDGVKGTAMLPFNKVFTEQEIQALARHVRSFDKKLKPES